MSQSEQETTTNGHYISTTNLIRYVKNLEDFLIKGRKQEVVWCERSEKFVVRNTFLIQSEKRRILDEISLWHAHLNHREQRQ